MNDKETINVVNLVDWLHPLNMGVWDGALSTSGALEGLGVRSYLAAPEISLLPSEKYSLQATLDVTTRKKQEFLDFLSSNELTAKNTVIAAHGCWKFPNRWLAVAAGLGFKTVACPQGMLEKWSLKHKRIRKAIFFQLVEKGRLGRATVIRAVGSPEQSKLKKLLPSADLRLIANGTPVLAEAIGPRPQNMVRFAFIGRLHAKKCPAQLAEAFVTSRMCNDPGFELVLAGPDQGELPAILSLLKEHQCSNARHVGSVFGDDKAELLRKTSFFVLPSQSEGFPTAVLEAMNYGCVPIISPGCNFPEARDNQIGFDVQPQVASIRNALERAGFVPAKEFELGSQNAVKLIRDNYTIPVIARHLNRLYRELLRSV